MKYKNNFFTNKPVLFVNQSIGPLFEDIINSGNKKTDIKVFEGIAYLNKNYFSRFWTWSIYSIQLYLHIIKNDKKYSKILFVTNPPFTIFIALVTKTPYAFLLYDLYPQVLKQLNMPKLFFKSISLVWNIVNKKIFTKAFKIYTLSNSMADKTKQYFIVEDDWKEKVKVIPPWANTNNLYPVPISQNNFRKKYNYDSKLLVTYSGNLGLTHPVEIIVNASILVNSNCKIMIIGSGPKLNLLKKIAQKNNIDKRKLNFLEKLPYSLLSESSSAADISVVTLDRKSSDASLPSKTFTSLATGTPIVVLAPDESGIAKLIKKHKCGIVIEPNKNSHKELANLINYYSSNKKELKKLSDNALEASKFYTQKNADILIEDFLKE